MVYHLFPAGSSGHHLQRFCLRKAVRVDRDDVLDIVELGLAVAVSVGLAGFLLRSEMADNFRDKVQKLPKIKIVKIK